MFDDLALNPVPEICLVKALAISSLSPFKKEDYNFDMRS